MLRKSSAVQTLRRRCKLLLGYPGIMTGVLGWVADLLAGVFVFCLFVYKSKLLEKKVCYLEAKKVICLC